MSLDLKKKLRHDISLIKKAVGKDALVKRSVSVMQRLEECPLFKQAACVALYHSLPDEVSTIAFIEKWYKSKTILLPVVEGENLRLLPYKGHDFLKVGAYGILEPLDDKITLIKPDIIVVPGVAFDCQGNRLGRGKGYYDRFLSNLNIKTIGICFDFQFLKDIPSEPFDWKMDVILTESQTIEI